MPLKHLTETLLIILLCVVTMITGVLASTLPALPEGFLPFVILMGLALAYALSLYPVLKQNRADYEFRILHLLPAVVLLIWLIAQLVTLYIPAAASLSKILTWGSFLSVIVIGFGLLAWFCVHVLRRWTTRLSLIGVLLLLFVGWAATSEVFFPNVTPVLTANVWQGDFWKLIGRTGESSSSSSSLIAGNTQSSVLLPGQTWEDRLKDDHQKSQASQSSVSTPKPPVLSSAGPVMNVFVLLFIAGYCGAVHQKTRRRAELRIKN